MSHGGETRIKEACLALYNKSHEIFRMLPISDETIIGSQSDCRIVIHNNSEIQPKHVKIVKVTTPGDSDKYLIFRYNEQCSLTINDKVVNDKSVELRHNDLIAIGTVTQKVFGFRWHGRHVSSGKAVDSSTASSSATSSRKNKKQEAQSTAPTTTAQKEISSSKLPKRQQQAVTKPDSSAAKKKNKGKEIKDKKKKQEKNKRVELVEHSDSEQEEEEEQAVVARASGSSRSANKDVSEPQPITQSQTQQALSRQASPPAEEQTQIASHILTAQPDSEDEAMYSEITEMNAEYPFTQVMHDSTVLEEEGSEKDDAHTTQSQHVDSILHIQEQNAQVVANSPENQTEEAEESTAPPKSASSTLPRAKIDLKRKSAELDTSASKKPRLTSQDSTPSQPSQDLASMTFENLIQSFNTNTITKLQELTAEVNKLRAENQNLKHRAHSTGQQVDESLINEILQEKLRYESLYDDKVSENLRLQDQMRKLQQKNSDLQRSLGERSNIRVDEFQKIQNLYLQAKNALLDKDKLLKGAEVTRKSLEANVDKVRSENTSLHKKIADMNAEIDRYKTQIMTRESHMNQTLKINVEACHVIEEDTRAMLSEYHDIREQINSLLTRGSLTFARRKLNIFTQTANVSEEMEPKSTPPMAENAPSDEPMGTDALNSAPPADKPTTTSVPAKPKHTFSRVPLPPPTANRDIEEARRIATQRAPRIGSLAFTQVPRNNNDTAVNHSSGPNTGAPLPPKKATKVTFKDIDNDSVSIVRPLGESPIWSKKRSKAAEQSSQMTQVTFPFPSAQQSQRVSSSDSLLSVSDLSEEEENNLRNLHFDNLSDNDEQISFR